MCERKLREVKLRNCMMALLTHTPTHTHKHTRRLMDHDTYSAHDVIGKVYINLNSLMDNESPSMLTGWFPIFDTLHGVCVCVHVCAST